jgi:hypothetical protein
MTVIRLADGSLMLHSPVALDPELRRELDSLGRVRFAVAPNRFHHLYADEVVRAYPEARLSAAPGVEHKRSDLAIEGVLGDEAPEEWKDELDQIFFRGRPLENEVVFLHRASRDLSSADTRRRVPDLPVCLTRCLRATSIGVATESEVSSPSLRPPVYSPTYTLTGQTSTSRWSGRGGPSSGQSTERGALPVRLRKQKPRLAKVSGGFGPRR